MSRALFLRELKGSLVPVLATFSVLALYAVCIVVMYDPEFSKSLRELEQAMPELFAAFGMADQGSTLLDFLVNYLYGFLLIMVPLALIMVLANKLVVSRIERGTMACLLATPTSRSSIARTQLAVILTALALTLAATIACEVGTAEGLFPGELDLAAFARVNIGLAALLLLFCGLVFAAACALPHPAAARWTGGGICIASYVLWALSAMDEKLEALGIMTPLALFDTDGLIAGDAAALLCAAGLAVAGIVFCLVGILAFRLRDLNV